jgi:hypothetical protein
MKRFKLFVFEDKGEFSSFKEACKVMMEEVRKALEGGGMSWQALESFIWIEEMGNSVVVAWDFYACRDWACNQGMMEDGKWIEDQNPMQPAPHYRECMSILPRQ